MKPPATKNFFFVIANEMKQSSVKSGEKKDVMQGKRETYLFELFPFEIASLRSQ
jgi:hypothetical protein